MKRIAIFASGRGSNAEKIIEYFRENQYIEVALIVSNKRSAKVLEIAKHYEIPWIVIERKEFYESQTLLQELQAKDITFIALAGFLWLVPQYIIDAYDERIVNLHPALLPKFGGKGMFGIQVHRAVKAAGEKETGITIHHVNNRYDEGKIIFQARIPVTPHDSPEDIALKVQRLEHQYFATTIERLLREDTT